jgi:hypothetical protein
MYNYFPNQYQNTFQPLMGLPSKPRTELRMNYGKEVDTKKKKNPFFSVPGLNNSMLNNNQMQNQYNQIQQAGFGINNNPFSIYNSTNTGFNIPMMRYRGFM